MPFWRLDIRMKLRKRDRERAWRVWSSGRGSGSSYDTFKAGWQSEWEKDLPDETMRARYNNLSIMLEIETGDYIIVPKDEICDVKMPHIYVQAKKKTGKDTGDIVGVDQLVKMEEHHCYD